MPADNVRFHLKQSSLLPKQITSSVNVWKLQCENFDCWKSKHESHGIYFELYDNNGNCELRTRVKLIYN